MVHKAWSPRRLVSNWYYLDGTGRLALYERTQVFYTFDSLPAVADAEIPRFRKHHVAQQNTHCQE